MKNIRIGLFGFGCVGQGLYDVLTQTPSLKSAIERICIRHPEKPRSIPMHHFTTERDQILHNPQVNLVVELIDSVTDAYQIVTTAMKNGKSVVSANKKMIAEHLEELVNLQHETGTSLLYEASCCGSIPIIRTLEEYYDNELLYSLSGIMNGSSNYILTKIFRDGASYQEALRQAQQLGFAESDPTLDVGGYDAKNKLVILAAHSFGVFVRPQEVFTYGIDQIGLHDLGYAREKSLKVKQIATVRQVGEGLITLYVMPRFVKQEDYLYSVEMEYNGVIVEAAFSDRQFFRGKGAGGHPTGSAVLSDISASRYDYKYEYKKSSGQRALQYTRDIEIDVYFRYSHPDQLQPERFRRIKERYESEHFRYVIATVGLNDLFSSSYFRQPQTCLVEMSSQR